MDHFLQIGGLQDLIWIIENNTGNTLAVRCTVPRKSPTHSLQYALTAMQNLMDNDYGWENLGSAFICRVGPAASASVTPGLTAASGCADPRVAV